MYIYYNNFIRHANLAFDDIGLARLLKYFGLGGEGGILTIRAIHHLALFKNQYNWHRMTIL
jgi:hypothetical protein